MKELQFFVLAMTAALTLSGAAQAQGKMGMGMMGDGDAKVTKEQFLKHAEERFARMDANKDGVIDASDRQKMREQMGKCMEMMGGMGMMSGGMMGGMGDKAGGATPQGDDHSAHHPAP
jgi:hypothetical protein